MSLLKWMGCWVATVLLSGGVSAQFRDSLATNKGILAAKFLPWHANNLSFAAFQLEPAELIRSTGDFRSYAHHEYQQEQDAQLRELKMKDVDFFCRNLLLTYKRNYGVDSVLQQVYYDLSKGEQNKEVQDRKKLDAAYKAMRTKTLLAADSHLLDSLVFTGWEITDSLLYVNSQAYRTVAGDKVGYLINNVYRKENTPGNKYNVLLKIVNDDIKDPFLKQYFQASFTVNMLRFPLDTAARGRAYADFLAMVTDTSLRRRVTEVYENVNAVKAGSDVPEFMYPDINDKPVSLKSLRGKYVYIDFWATWCSPCKAEIPYLEKLQEWYKDKNIAFVSLSVDRMADKGKWQSFVKDHQLGGIQVLADKNFESDFVKKFNITSIPRFLLIDPQGKILSLNADRPSNPKLKQQLDRLSVP